MKKISFILLIIMAFAKANGQDFTTPKTLADKAFRDKNYYEAAYYYKQAAQGMDLVKPVAIPYHANVRRDSKANVVDRAYICFMLAESYRLYDNYVEAEPWYYAVLNENYESKYPLARMWYAVCLRASQHFDECVKQMTQFKTAYKGDSKYIELADKEIATCNFAKEQYQFPALVDVVKLKTFWNADGSNYSIIKRDGNFWFTSSRYIKESKKHLNKIYTVKNNNISVVNLKDERKDQLEYGTPSLDPTGKRMYLTRWYKEGARTIHGIYISEWQNGEWSAPKKLNNNINVDGYNSIQPSITADGKRMFFVSNKPGGQGGDDIWVSDLGSDGNPVNSVNLGKTINSSQDEEAPYYDAANKRLIYSSKGFIGLGGFDFFESTENHEKMGQWSTPHNMGYPFNSAKDDLYYYPDDAKDNKVYISSDRESDCCLDLFEVDDRKYILKGLVVDCDTHELLQGATVKFVDSISKETLKSVELGRKGEYTFNVTTKRPYNLVVEKEGYFTKVLPVPTKGKMSRDTLYNPDICLQAFKVDKPIVLKNILYDFNMATLRPESKIVLNDLVTIMKDNPKIKVELSSHTDSIGSDAYNQNLSQQRAQSCVDYIIQSGITDDRIFAKGYGKTKPVAPNSLPDGKDNPDGRQLNRRTEFTVLKTE